MNTSHLCWCRFCFPYSASNVKERRGDEGGKDRGLRARKLQRSQVLSLTSVSLVVLETLLSLLSELKKRPLLYGRSQIKFKAQLGGGTGHCSLLVAMVFGMLLVPEGKLKLKCSQTAKQLWLYSV